jgi:hypothetical protein
MPRVQPSVVAAAAAAATTRKPAQNNHNTSSNQSRFFLRRWWDNGSLLLAVGWTGMAVWTLDQYLQYQDDYEQRRRHAVERLRRQEIMDHVARERHELLLQHRHTPALFRCVVRRASAMGGSHGLRSTATTTSSSSSNRAGAGNVNDTDVNDDSIQVNDIVEVLEEGVGPDKYYNLCRTRSKETGEVDAVGWYPIVCLEKLEEAETNKKKKKSYWTFWRSS